MSSISSLTTFFVNQISSRNSPLLAYARRSTYPAGQPVSQSDRLQWRTCARLCHLAGGELDQIQFLLGHVSIQTTERYYLQKVDMCSGCPKSPIVNARAWLDSA